MATSGDNKLAIDMPRAGSADARALAQRCGRSNAGGGTPRLAKVPTRSGRDCPPDLTHEESGVPKGRVIAWGKTVNPANSKDGN